MRWKNARLGLVLLLSLLPWLGCAALRGNLEPPEVFLIGLEPLPGSPLEQRFAVDLRVVNPNDRDLKIDGVDFTLAVNDSRLTRGVSNEELTIPRLGEGVLTVHATTTLFDVLRQVLNAAEPTDLEDGVRYELHGQIFMANSPATLSFTRSGTFTVGRPSR